MQRRDVVATVLAALGCCAPQQAVFASEVQWTAVTLARDGTIGSAVHSSRAKAVSLAIADCKRIRRWSNDCGSLLVALQEGWAVARLCGPYNILVMGRTLAEAEAEASKREADLRAGAVETVPTCGHVATFGGDVVERNATGWLTLSEY